MHSEMAEPGGAGTPSAQMDSSYGIHAEDYPAVSASGRRRSRREMVLSTVSLISVTLCSLALLRGGGFGERQGDAGVRELGMRELRGSPAAAESTRRWLSSMSAAIRSQLHETAAPTAAEPVHLAVPKVGSGASILMQGVQPGMPVPEAGWVADNAKMKGVRDDLKGWRDDLKKVVSNLNNARAHTTEEEKNERTQANDAAIVRPISTHSEAASTADSAAPIEVVAPTLSQSVEAAHQMGFKGIPEAVVYHPVGGKPVVYANQAISAADGAETKYEGGALKKSAHILGLQQGVPSEEANLSPLAKALLKHLGKNLDTADTMKTVGDVQDVAHAKPLIPSKLSKELTNVISQIVRQAAANVGEQAVKADKKHTQSMVVHGGVTSKVSKSSVAGIIRSGMALDGTSPDGEEVVDGSELPSPLSTAGDVLSKAEHGDLDASLINATSSVPGTGVGVMDGPEDPREDRGWLAYKRIPLTYVAWLCAALCVIFTMLMSTNLILRHLDYYANPDTQKYVVRILFMAPIYAVDSLLALTFVGWATTYIDVFRDCYEAFTIYNFLKLLVVLLGGERAVIEMLEKRPQVPLIFPLHWMEPWEMGAELFYSCKYGALQYVLVKPTCALIMFISGAAGLYGPNSFSLARLHFYVFFFSNVSQMWALYCLVMFYVALKDELAPFNPVLKFVIVKAVVFFCFWQGMLLGMLAYMGYIQDTDDFDAAHIVEAIQELLVCVEMVIVSVLSPFFPPLFLPSLGGLREACQFLCVWKHVCGNT